jgi:hypothetical protein
MYTIEISRTNVRKDVTMSAMEISVTTVGSKARSSHLHLVQEGEISANWKRKMHAHTVLRARRIALARRYAALGSVTALFTTAMVTIAWAFWSIPNLPLP